MLSYYFRRKEGNTYYFNSNASWPVYDCPDYDRVRQVRLLRVYVYPFHSPCYYMKNKIAYYKHGIKVDRFESTWIPCKASDLHASYESMNVISDICGIRLYRGAWV